MQHEQVSIVMLPSGICRPSFPIITANSTSRSTSQPIFGIRIGSLGPIIQEENLLKIKGSFGSGKSCSLQ